MAAMGWGGANGGSWSRECYILGHDALGFAANINGSFGVRISDFNQGPKRGEEATTTKRTADR